MIFNNVKNLEAFFETVDQCKGNVYLVSDEGDKINLKSKLSQYVSYAMIINGGGVVPELRIEADTADDRDILLNFMINGKGL